MRGIVHRPDSQLILVDTPGLHKPRTLLGERLNDVVRTTWAEVDVIGFCLPANEKLGPGDRFIAKELARDQEDAEGRGRHEDRPGRLRGAGRAADRDRPARQELGIEWAEIVPVSASRTSRSTLLADLLVRAAARGPAALPGRATSPTSPSRSWSPS